MLSSFAVTSQSSSLSRSSPVSGVVPSVLFGSVRVLELLPASLVSLLLQQ